jgi:BirA family biotin operon repressor/biotin-[acetyl-CoA-carboxylase] ligase
MSLAEGPYAGIAAELAGTRFARIRYVAETASTNADALALLGTDGGAGLTIVAEFQSSGAGRKGRTWIAAPGSSLLFTTILPDAMPVENLWIVPFWTVLAVGRALRACGIETATHWPNDLLLGEAKIAGILCISRTAGERANAACGVGINVSRDPGANAIEPPAAFCNDRVPVERPALLRAVLAQFDATLESLAHPLRVARRWEEQAGLPGRRYRLLRDGESEPFEATAIALADGGALVVERDGGARETIALADARALRTL